jgi:hypothetical protein
MSTIISELQETSNEKEIFAVLEKYYPDWVVNCLAQYSDDYPVLTKNWQHICKLVSHEPSKILLVSQLAFKDKRQIEVCDYLTKQGYCVRRFEEFTSCIKCKSAIPCEEVYNSMKNKGVQVPEVWIESCQKCKV